MSEQIDNDVENNNSDQHVEAINWNRVGEVDKQVWDRLTANFWLPEKINLASDLSSWKTLTDDEKLSTTRVFAGLTLLDTIQGFNGATSLMKDAQTPHEEAVYANIAFMEAFSGDTMLLTENRGWIAIAEVTADDLVAQFDPSSEKITFAHPTIIPSHFAEEVYKISSRDGSMEQVVSGGHRVYVERYDADDDEWNHSVIEARNTFPYVVGRSRGQEISTQRFRFRGLPSENIDVNNPQYVFERGWDMEMSSMDAQEVYCVKVPTTFLVTRHGDSTPVISGNCVHAKTYSSIFSTLLTTRETDDAFRFSRENEYLQYKEKVVLKYYNEDDAEKKKIVSTLLESFLFYSGFFMPMWWDSKGKLSSTADLIRLILRDESIHGYYIGYKFQIAYQKSTPERQKELREFAENMVHELYDNECKYTAMLYDHMGLTAEVKKFLRYNANKAFQNLGFEPPFDPRDAKILPEIAAALNPTGDANHDFFSGQGASYTLGVSRSAQLEDDDWEAMLGDDDWG